MLRIRLSRTGRKNYPSYRIVVAEHARPVKSKFIEILGNYIPIRDPKVLEFDEKKIREWIAKGAKPTDTVASLLKNAGMTGLEQYIESRDKKKKKKKEVEEAPAPAAATPAVEEPKAEEAAAAVEAPAEEPKAEAAAVEEPKKEEAAPAEEPKAEEAAAAPAEETPAAAPAEEPKAEAAAVEAPAEEAAAPAPAEEPKKEE